MSASRSEPLERANAARLDPVGGPLGGLVTGAPLGWFGRQLVYDLIEKPLLVTSIETRERDACTIRTMDAARRAGEAEAAVWKHAAEEARAEEEALAAVRDADRVREIDNLNRRIEANEQRLLAEGRSCPLDADTERWLREQWGLPPAAD